MEKMMRSKMIYADHASTTNLSPNVIRAIIPYLTKYYGNPSSAHTVGRIANDAVEEARTKIAECLQCYPSEVFFTSGATESNNWAIWGSLLASNKKHLVVSSIEHPSVLNLCKHLAYCGYKASYVGADENGVVKLQEIENSISDDTALVAVMAVNNETGVIQPIDEISQIAHKRGVPFFCDAVQAIGRIPIHLNNQKIDYLSISGHKIHSTKGTGILYVNRNSVIPPVIYGGGQENGLRSGTENVPGIVGISVALQDILDIGYDNATVQQMSEKILRCINSIPFSQINGYSARRVPGLVNACFEFIDGSDLVNRLNSLGICVSSSSACGASSQSPSHVLLAMGIPEHIARGSLRISINEYNTMEEVDYICKVLPDTVQSLRNFSPEYLRFCRRNGFFSQV